MAQSDCRSKNKQKIQLGVSKDGVNFSVVNNESYSGRNNPQLVQQQVRNLRAVARRRRVAQGATAGFFTGSLFGGGAGAGIGAAVGAGLGSIVPGVGTLIGAVAGATIGGIVGAGTAGGAGVSAGAVIAASIKSDE